MWKYLKEKISINEDGLFVIEGENSLNAKFESLKSTKKWIADRKKVYYDFTHEDINNMLAKLSEREREVIIHIAKAYNCHLDNAYCALGNTMEDFNIDINYLSKAH